VAPQFGILLMSLYYKLDGINLQLLWSRFEERRIMRWISTIIYFSKFSVEEKNSLPTLSKVIKFVYKLFTDKPFT